MTLSATETLSALNTLGPIFHSCYGIIPNKDDPSVCDLPFWDDDDGEVYPNFEEMTNLAKKEIPFKKVTVKYEKDTWFGKPNEWWNDPEQRHYGVGKYYTVSELPLLKDVKYIKVVEPFMRVDLSSTKKKSNLTVHDVLLACNALCLDNSRTIGEGFKVLSQTDTELVLEPQIDNFST